MNCTAVGAPCTPGSVGRDLGSDPDRNPGPAGSAQHSPWACGRTAWPARSSARSAFHGSDSLADGYSRRPGRRRCRADPRPCRFIMSRGGLAPRSITALMLASAIADRIAGPRRALPPRAVRCGTIMRSDPRSLWHAGGHNGSFVIADADASRAHPLRADKSCTAAR